MDKHCMHKNEAVMMTTRTRHGPILLTWNGSELIAKDAVEPSSVEDSGEVPARRVHLLYHATVIQKLVLAAQSSQKVGGWELARPWDVSEWLEVDTFSSELSATQAGPAGE
ncbi:hypothetical protein PRZ48_005691 [Zasmidium cellare]|uniref:Uncharacterized protein n=1 Tax=Zasmidium cellare TaxID=395010 RepID=A0ABR0EM85_ZASCE|nr:hypothetical protein PRZ48_005691 [Zasmidium cellare]